MRNLSWGIPLACVLILVLLWTTQQAFLNQDQVKILMIQDGEHIYCPIVLNNFLQAFCICHQLKRELGVLKASYLQIASLVGGENKVEKEYCITQKVIVSKCQLIFDIHIKLTELKPSPLQKCDLF